jgi:hypothetical protein
MQSADILTLRELPEQKRTQVQTQYAEPQGKMMIQNNPEHSGTKGATMLIKAKTLNGYKLEGLDGEIGMVREFTSMTSIG